MKQIRKVALVKKKQKDSIFPKSIVIGGVTWSIIMDKNISGGIFNWSKKEIRISTKNPFERQFNALLHEIIEVITVNNNIRYVKQLSELGNGDYLFSFNHDQFEIMVNEIGGIILHSLMNVE